MGTIYWSEFSWEAFATLATGLAAVIGAYLLGARQLQMMDLERRAALFERRYSVLAGVHTFASYLMTSGSLPAPEDDAGLRIAMANAQFLFSDETVAKLRAFEGELDGLVGAIRSERASVTPERGGPASEEVEAVRLRRAALGDWSARAVDILKAEMRLAH